MSEEGFRLEFPSGYLLYDPDDWEALRVELDHRYRITRSKGPTRIVDLLSGAERRDIWEREAADLESMSRFIRDQGERWFGLVKKAEEVAFRRALDERDRMRDARRKGGKVGGRQLIEDLRKATLWYARSYPGSSAKRCWIWLTKGLGARNFSLRVLDTESGERKVAPPLEEDPSGKRAVGFHGFRKTYWPRAKKDAKELS